MKRLAVVLLSAVAAAAWLSPASGATYPARIYEAVGTLGPAVAPAWSSRALIHRVYDRDGWHRWHGRGGDEGDDWDGGDDDGVRTHIYFGFGPLWSPYVAPPSYWRPPTVVVSPPPVYISPDDADRRRPYYWYYCPAPKGYYPYIKTCPPGWLKVVPHPPHH